MSEQNENTGREYRTSKQDENTGREYRTSLQDEFTGRVHRMSLQDEDDESVFFLYPSGSFPSKHSIVSVSLCWNVLFFVFRVYSYRMMSSRTRIGFSWLFFPHRHAGDSAGGPQRKRHAIAGTAQTENHHQGLAAFVPWSGLSSLMDPWKCVMIPAQASAGRPRNLRGDQGAHAGGRQQRH